MSEDNLLRRIKKALGFGSSPEPEKRELVENNADNPYGYTEQFMELLKQGIDREYENEVELSQPEKRERAAYLAQIGGAEDFRDMINPYLGKDMFGRPLTLQGYASGMLTMEEAKQFYFKDEDDLPFRPDPGAPAA